METVFNQPFFGTNGRRVALQTPTVSHELMPAGCKATTLSMSNLPVTADGQCVCFDLRELNDNPFCQSDATKEPAMASLLRGEISLANYKTQVRFSYGKSNVADPQQILDSKILNGPQLARAKAVVLDRRADVILVQPLESPDEWPEDSDVRHVDFDAWSLRRLEQGLSQNFKLFQYLGPRRFVALVGQGKKNVAGRDVNFQPTWVVCGILPKDDYQPEQGDGIWTKGRGVIIVMSVDVGDLIVYSMVKYMLGIHKDWMQMHPAPEQIPQNQADEEPAARVEPVETDEEPPRKSTAKGKRKERRAKQHMRATLGELLAANGQELKLAPDELTVDEVVPLETTATADPTL